MKSLLKKITHVFRNNQPKPLNENTVHKNDCTKTTPSSDFNNDKAFFLQPSQNADKFTKSKVYKQDKYFDEIEELLNGVDLNSPPGLAGDICNDIALTERRALPSLRLAAALVILSMLSHKRLNIDGEKMTFFAMITALSGSGKEAHQRYVKELMAALGHNEMFHGKPRSDRNIILDLFESLGVVYLLDEGHELFNKALSSKSASFESGMGDLLLELKTTSLYLLSGNYTREIGAKVSKEIEQLSKKVSLTQHEESHLLKLEMSASYIKNGMDNPYVSLASYSTPTKADSLINEETICSGFIGRFFYFRGEKFRGKLITPSICRPSKHIFERCKALNGLNDKIKLSPDCEDFLKKVTEYFDQDKLLNHIQLGAIYARATEQIKQMASLLSVETGVVTVEELLYSTRYFQQNIDYYTEVINKKLINDQQKVLKSADEIIKQTSQKRGSVTKGILANQLDRRSSTIRKMRLEQDSKFHYKLINILIKQGRVIEENGKYLHIEHNS
tara:strand:+ start:1747 stop:3255 length:1509 start_codon:yes stop_codon:yes gene_type:complete